MWQISEITQVGCLMVDLLGKNQKYCQNSVSLKKIKSGLYVLRAKNFSPFPSFRPKFEIFEKKLPLYVVKMAIYEVKISQFWSYLAEKYCCVCGKLAKKLN